MSSPNCHYCNDTGVDEMTDAYRRFVRCPRCPAGIQAEIEHQKGMVAHHLEMAQQHLVTLNKFIDQVKQ